MNQVKSLTDLRKLKEDFQDKLKIREKGLDAEKHVQIKVAMGTCGIAAGAKGVMDFLIDELDKRNVEAVVTQTGCMGYCFAEPTVEVSKPGAEPVVFGYVNARKINDIIERYIKNGEMTDGILPRNVPTIDQK